MDSPSQRLVEPTKLHYDIKLQQNLTNSFQAIGIFYS